MSHLQIITIPNLKRVIKIRDYSEIALAGLVLSNLDECNGGDINYTFQQGEESHDNKHCEDTDLKRSLFFRLL